jgi:hypothetical protein
MHGKYCNQSLGLIKYVMMYGGVEAELHVRSQSYVTTEGQSDSLSWCQAPIWDPRPIYLLSL